MKYIDHFLTSVFFVLKNKTVTIYMERQIFDASSKFLNKLNEVIRRLEDKNVEIQSELVKYKIGKGEIGKVVYSCTYMDLTSHISELEDNISSAIKNNAFSHFFNMLESRISKLEEINQKDESF